MQLFSTGVYLGDDALDVCCCLIIIADINTLYWLWSGPFFFLVLKIAVMWKGAQDDFSIIGAVLRLVYLAVYLNRAVSSSA
ncbi:hypothetical protein EJ05DRAFT_268699 [Pseudovirgaria hyperparasitica]|uniref:Uncharacterized protein n=1 Tax=Pseudovirgaria hyperparasitica TaxID=470096 RepID=A0A6A6VRE0_9PEZI|nr:uncharacterized protein EJ05DRAFT_268699 [Pseudovirgaria hyperparasitica]KAF2752715.1 hypothetical protein EJ05DRAFT_268699 [Pseudovirgaria hyperparasitica]